MFEVVLTVCVFSGLFSTECKVYKTYDVESSQDLQGQLKECKLQADDWYVKLTSYAHCKVKTK